MKVMKSKQADLVPRVVDTVPGWAHNITNIGSKELIVIIWQMKFSIGIIPIQ